MTSEPPLRDDSPQDAPAREAGTALDRNGPPLWVQLRDGLLARIADGGMPPHSRLPSEAELCAEFGVSRTVVREALNQLVVDGRVYKVQGKGSFVADTREAQDFVGSNISFSRDFLGRDDAVLRIVLSQRLRAPTDHEAEMLKLGPREKVVEFDRLLMVDGVPRLIVYTQLRATDVPGFTELHMHDKSLYATLSQRYGLTIREAERWIEAVSAREDIAAMLRVPEGTPILRIESVSTGTNSVPVEHYIAYYRSDKAQLHFKIS